MPLATAISIGLLLIVLALFGLTVYYDPDLFPENYERLKRRIAEGNTQSGE